MKQEKKGDILDLVRNLALLLLFLSGREGTISFFQSNLSHEAFDGEKLTIKLDMKELL
ncbi:hypothetical protein [Aerococcus christensenii]|uniref:hypothetical protein n=1 Tax=Aerococcus christensenii TaxID=87541 RepID=UPI000B0BEC98|nr:hypothetical protein [Aerococcus christensenii]